MDQLGSTSGDARPGQGLDSRMNSSDSDLLIISKLSVSDEYSSRGEGDSEEQNHEAETGTKSSLQKEVIPSQNAETENATNGATVYPLLPKEDAARLHIASRNGQANLVEHLLSTDESVDAIDADGRTPLHVAAEAGHSEIVYLLLHKGAKPRARDNTGLIARDLASDPAVIWLLKNGTESSDTDVKGDYFIHFIIKTSSEKAIEDLEWALERGYDVHDKDCDDNTPLNCAVKKGSMEITRLLVKYGALVTEKDVNGFSPLMFAARDGNYGIARYLLDKGAPIEDPDSEGATVENPNISALVEAAREGHIRIVQLLLNRGAQIDYRSGEWTALSIASSRGHYSVVRALVEAGADIDDQANESNRHLPLAEACHYSHMQIVDYLLEKGADVELHGRMHWIMGGETVLIAAARANRYEVVRSLLKFGADAEYKGAGGKTALDYAKEMAHEQVVAVLQDHFGDKREYRAPSRRYPYEESRASSHHSQSQNYDYRLS